MSAYLIHWTGRKKSQKEAWLVLIKILHKETLRLSLCPTHMKGMTQQAKELMTCFTELGLSRSRLIMPVFGACGIAYRKDRMISYGANPVMYYTKQNAHHYLNFIQAFLGIAPTMPPTAWTSFRRSIQFFQPFTYDPSSRKTNYHQKEWRLVFDDTRIVVPNTRIASTDPSLKGKFRVGPNGKARFAFAIQDVDYVLVPFRFYFRTRRFLAQRHYKATVIPSVLAYIPIIRNLVDFLARL